MNRREWIVGTGAMLTTILTQSAYASSHEHTHTAGQKYGNIIDSSYNCLNKGRVCIQHCLDNFGDLALKDCANSVQDMYAVCSTMTQLAVSESPYLKDYIKICINVCRDCEAACRVHEKTHAECKECADACARCRKECEKVLAAM
jgi:Cys-rich four helix bundle protein (predicted Tat secretion target)